MAKYRAVPKSATTTERGLVSEAPFRLRDRCSYRLAPRLPLLPFDAAGHAEKRRDNAKVLRQALTQCRHCQRSNSMAAFRPEADTDR